MNRFAVLSEEYEHLGFPLGRHEAAEGMQFSERKERYSLHRAQSEGEAKIALLASSAMEEHASLPVGYVQDSQGGIFMVCKRGGRKVISPPDELEGQLKRGFCSAVISRLASLHSQGLGCGGIKPDAVELSDGGAKLLNPSAIFVLEGESPAFYEAACTLRALVASGFALQGELAQLASEYISSSPACRHAIASHARKKGCKGRLSAFLADSASKYLAILLQKSP
jgi:hypothetical protein